MKNQNGAKNKMPTPKKINAPQLIFLGLQPGRWANKAHKDNGWQFAKTGARNLG